MVLIDGIPMIVMGIDELIADNLVDDDHKKDR